MKLDTGARDAIVEALKDAGYKDVWVQQMSSKGATAIVVTEVPIEEAEFKYGDGLLPKAVG